MIDDTVNSIVTDMLQWPHRLVVPLGVNVDTSDLELKPQGRLSVTVVKATSLVNMEMIGKSDPYVVLYIRPMFKVKTKVVDHNLNPEWNETFHLIVEDKETQSVIFEVTLLHGLMSNVMYISRYQVFASKYSLRFFLMSLQFNPFFSFFDVAAVHSLRVLPLLPLPPRRRSLAPPAPRAAVLLPAPRAARTPRRPCAPPGPVAAVLLPDPRAAGVGASSGDGGGSAAMGDGGGSAAMRVIDKAKELCAQLILRIPALFLILCLSMQVSDGYGAIKRSVLPFLMLRMELTFRSMQVCFFRKVKRLCHHNAHRNMPLNIPGYGNELQATHQPVAQTSQERRDSKASSTQKEEVQELGPNQRRRFRSWNFVAY